MSRQRFVLLCLIFCVAVSAALVHASSQNSNLQAVVTGDSKPVANAFVMVRGIKNEGVWETRTEANGTFALRIGTGCYHLFASAGGFFPYAERFCVNFDTESVNLKLKLRPDPLRYGVVD